MTLNSALTKLMAATVFLGLMATRGYSLWSSSPGRDELHVDLKAHFGWDSNLYSSADGPSDTLLTTSVSADYARKAGLIGVDATIGVEAGHFGKFSSDDYINPRAFLEFTKGTGRTTGSLTGSIARNSEGDVAANVRAESWDYDTALKARYPVIDRYSVTGSTGYTLKEYINSPVLVDLETFHASSDLLYAINSQRDLFAGYRMRISDSKLDTVSRDHAFTIGVSGKILPKLTGTLRAGWQTRSTSGLFPKENDSGVTASAATTWMINPRASLTAQATKDYATTSTDIGTDSSAATLDLKMAATTRWSLNIGLGYGLVEFLGARGDEREDTYLTATGAATYQLRERLGLSLVYSYLNNWSTLALADHSRHSITAGVSSRF